MELKQIELLLSKYYEAETTLEEEETLRRYFAQPGLPAELEAHKVHFTWQAAASQAEASFSHPAQQPAAKVRTLGAFYLRAAAVLLPMGLAAWLWFSPKADQQVAQADSVEIQDPELALIETRKAFALMAVNMRQAQEEVSELSEINRVNKILQEL